MVIMAGGGRLLVEDAPQHCWCQGWRPWRADL